MEPTKLNSGLPSSRPVTTNNVINAENRDVEREQLNRILSSFADRLNTVEADSSGSGGSVTFAITNNDGTITVVSNGNTFVIGIADSGVSTTQLANNAVTTSKIADEAVTTAKIDDDAVTFAKMQNITSDRLLGRDTASSGDVEEISLDTTLEFTGSQVIRRAALSGDVTAPAGSNTTTLATVNANVGPFGTASQVGSFTVNGKGLITAASDTPIQIATSQVTGLGTMATQAAADYVTLATAQTITGAKALGGYQLSGFGSYGVLEFFSSAEYTGNARRWLMTNAYNGNSFALIRSADANSSASLNGTGGVSAGTLDVSISNAGAFTVHNDFSCTGNATLGDAATDTVDVKGRIFGSNLHNNASGLSGASYIGSGTYTPTATDIASAGTPTTYETGYLRVGNIVHSSGFIEMTPTASPGSVSFRITLPIASNFANVRQLTGCATVVDGANQLTAVIYADATNDQARFDVFVLSGGAVTIYYTLTYLVV